MSSTRLWSCAIRLSVGMLCWFLGQTLEAQTRHIRLRNETITTPAKSASSISGRSANDAAVSGLYLVQFAGTLQEPWRAELQAAGVDLLRYVPDDAFVARLTNVRLSELSAKAFVHWVGEYEAGLKVYAPLWRQVLNSTNDAKVSLLISPRATPLELATLRQALKATRRESVTRFGAILEGRVSAAQLNALANSSAVLWIEPAPQPKLFDELAARIVGGEPDDFEYRGTYTQELGFDGSGVTVAVADSGLDNGSTEGVHPDIAGRVVAALHYGELEDGSDEHSHGTHVTGIIAGNGATGEADEGGYRYGVGVAPGAQVIGQRIFDGVGNYTLVDNDFDRLTRDATELGAEIGSNSWGDDTQSRYDLSAAMFDALVRDANTNMPGDQPYILEFSAGNAGPGTQTIGSPAVAKNVIATGASQNNRLEFFIYAEGQETMADFSSRGPAEDGRIKPDVVAPGTWIASLQSSFASDENAWLPISSYYQYQGGTSQSGPQVSGAAAVFVQYYRELHTNATPSPALVKAALINSAVDMDDEVETPPAPNSDEGWGRVDLTEIIGSARAHDFLDQTILLTTDQVYEQRVVVASADEPLKITLVYTDVPGFPASIPALVNDLDLEVVAPDGSSYRGNQFIDGESVSDATSYDTINNVEGVHLYLPQPGEYLVRVHARNVVEDARRDTSAVDQDFALVVSGDLPLPGTAVVVMDRRAYTAPSKATIKLIDFDRAGQTSAQVRITSETEPAGEVMTLLASGPFGTFTNSINLVTGAAVADGQLQVAHDNNLEVVNLDGNAARPATALVDLVPPVISQVGVTNRFGSMVIQWQTDEPATSVVRYGTGLPPALEATARGLEEFHEVRLSDLLPDTTYFFQVTSVDEAGNSTTSDNGGNYYTFEALPAATVLLVYQTDTFIDGLDASSYTTALDQVGVSYEVWNIDEVGQLPGTNDLKPFRAVIWRMAEFDAVGLSVESQNVIRSYIESGGGFFMASMEALSRIGDNTFRRDILQVDEFTVPGAGCAECDEDHTVPYIIGVDNDQVTDGVDMELDYTTFDLFGGFFGPDFSDTFTPTTNAVPIIYDAFSGRVAGIRYPRVGVENFGRVVFYSFALEAVPEFGDAPNSRAAMLRSALEFLAPGAEGLGTLALDSSTYTIPSRVVIELADSDLAGDGQVTVNIRSDTATQNQSITLQETARRGLFQAAVTLVDASEPGAPGQLRAQHGDEIHVTYQDISANRTLEVAAYIDTEAPVISNVLAEPDYGEVFISWDTSKHTDALVQFGESRLLGRTGYNFEATESHEVQIVGLLPDRIYYYQVVSRDAAGNTTVDDNNGELYQFRTLKPLGLPWSDDMEAGATNWVVLDGEAGATWQLGVPNNGLETQANSPVSAWGSNLNGGAIDTADTFLVSPAIELPADFSTKLRFWHSYDFPQQSEFDIYEFGQLYVSTNNGTVWNLLAEYGEFSFGWEEEVIDLTAYRGTVVRFGWYYGMFSLDSLPRYGWLLDDVSLESVRIRVTNNLAQASFLMEGAAAGEGEGWVTDFIDMPVGEYRVTYQPVPYYLTPSPQTNTLTSGNTLLFSGVYQFADVNTNGISDAWEQEKFSEVSPNRDATTDTDDDGATDFAEFFAGTNPNDATSHLALTMSNSVGGLEFAWPSSEGRAYRLMVSSDLVNWSAVSDWTRAEETNSTVTIESPTGGAEFYRIEVRP